jgi:hypothetical protein
MSKNKQQEEAKAQLGSFIRQSLARVVEGGEISPYTQYVFSRTYVV